MLKISRPFVFFLLSIALFSLGAFWSCENAHSNTPQQETLTPIVEKYLPDSLKRDSSTARIIHVFVALCDNDSQGIVPVPKKIGNGNDPNNNLYWGCGYGVRTFFNQSEDWQLVRHDKKASGDILERCIWKHRRKDVILVADAYKGARIKNCTVQFLENAAGACTDTTSAVIAGKRKLIFLNAAALVGYVGHDGLMDFNIAYPPVYRGTQVRDVIILACVSRTYFREPIKTAGARPLLWTTNLMAPEAYTLKAAIDGWILNETGEQVRQRAAQAYNQYQKCGLKGAQNLFATGF
ncbi:MAG: hypothetical protein ACRCYO_19220 [Bacteroidia bacterium]